MLLLYLFITRDGDYMDCHFVVGGPYGVRAKSDVVHVCFIYPSLTAHDISRIYVGRNLLRFIATRSQNVEVSLVGHVQHCTAARSQLQNHFRKLHETFGNYVCAMCSRHLGTLKHRIA